jgi:hypothetical protein
MQEIYLVYGGEDGTDGHLLNIYLKKQKALDSISLFLVRDEDRQNLYTGFDGKRTIWRRIDTWQAHT